MGEAGRNISLGGGGRTGADVECAGSHESWDETGDKPTGTSIHLAPVVIQNLLRQHSTHPVDHSRHQEDYSITSHIPALSHISSQMGAMVMEVSTESCQPSSLFHSKTNLRVWPPKVQTQLSPRDPGSPLSKTAFNPPRPTEDMETTEVAEDPVVKVATMGRLEVDEEVERRPRAGVAFPEVAVVVKEGTEVVMKGAAKVVVKEDMEVVKKEAGESAF